MLARAPGPPLPLFSIPQPLPFDLPTITMQPAQTHPAAGGGGSASAAQRTIAHATKEHVQSLHAAKPGEAPSTTFKPEEVRGAQGRLCAARGSGPQHGLLPLWFRTDGVPCNSAGTTARWACAGRVRAVPHLQLRDGHHGRPAPDQGAGRGCLGRAWCSAEVGARNPAAPTARRRRAPPHRCSWRPTASSWAPSRGSRCDGAAGAGTARPAGRALAGLPAPWPAPKGARRIPGPLCCRT